MAVSFAAENAKEIDENGTVQLTVVASDGGSEIARYPVTITGSDDYSAAQAFAVGWLAAYPEVPTDYAVPTVEVVRGAAIARIVIMGKALSSIILSRYDESEPFLWRDFEAEAKAFNSENVSSNTSTDYPNIAAHLVHKLNGPPSDEADALSRIAAAVPIMLGNAVAWRAISAFVSGLRARRQAELEVAADEAAINAIITAAAEEIAAKKIEFGL